MTGVVTLGETMALLSSAGFGPLQHERAMTLGIGGSESNVAIGLSRLGVGTTWIGKVGADAFGDLVIREISAEGVRVIALRDPIAPTSLMVKERRTVMDTRVFYYRHDNAGGHLQPSEVDPAVIRDASLLHLTGISPALSDGMSETVFEALRVAKEAGVPISFDLNYRSKLWVREEARASFLRIIPQVDIVFAGDDEAAIVVEAGDPLELARGLVELGAGQAVVKLGIRGAVAFCDGNGYSRDAIPVNAVDTVGAGDAFVAGYLADYLLGADIETRLTTAVTTGAYACLYPGDWEGAPRRHELTMLRGDDPVSR